MEEYGGFGGALKMDQTESVFEQANQTYEILTNPDYVPPPVALPNITKPPSPSPPPPMPLP